MKNTCTFLAVLLLSLMLYSSASATGLLTEDFNYADGALLTATGNWTAHSGTGTNALTVSSTGGSSGLSYTGYSNSNNGLSVTITAGTGEDDNRLFTGAATVSSGNVYMAAMVNVNTARTGDYFLHLGSGTSAFQARLFVKTSGAGYVFGIGKSSETPVYETTVRNLNTTYLVVVKYIFNAGTANDEADLFVNPTLGSEPSPILTEVGTASDATTIAAVFLRQGSTGGMPTVTVDGINVGTTWGDVIPSTGVATLTPSGTLNTFSQTSATPSAEQTYTISGNNLTNNVTVTPPTGYEISKTSGSGFVNNSGNLSFTPADLITSKTIYIRLNAPGAGNYSGDITHSSADFTTVNVPVTGSYTIDNGRVLTLTALVEALYVAGGTSMSMTQTVTVELRGANSPYSLVESQSGTLNTAGVGTFTFMNAVNGTNYYIVVKSHNTVENWSATAQSFSSNALSYDFTTAVTQSYGTNALALHNGKYCLYSGDNDQNGLVTSSDYTGIDNDNSNFAYHLINDLNGNGIITSADYTFLDNNNSLFIGKQVPAGTPPSLATTPTSLIGFSYTAGSGPSTSQSYNLSGTNLTGAPGIINVTGSNNYEVSNNSSTWGSSTTIAYSSATLSSTPVYVRLKSGLSAGSYNSENITISGGGASNYYVTCSGSVIAVPTLVSTPSTLSSFAYNVGSGPSVSQTYQLSGTNLTGAPGSITVTGSSDYEVSNNNTTWGSSTSIGYSSATLNNTPVYVRLKAGLSTGNYNSENITNSGGGATNINVVCSGSVNVIVSNVNLTMGMPTNATTDVNNPHDYLLVKPQFCASYDKDKGIPNWTSWQLNSTWCNGPGVRKDNYIPDATLPSAWYHVDDADYSGSGFSRGHMCPSADRINTQADNDALFYYTNMVPQNQNNNQGVWEGLEDYERVLANAGNTVYIICGSYGAGGTKTDNSATVTTISSGRVTVPAKLWKVMIVIPNGTGTDLSRVSTSTRTIAILMPNDSSPSSKTAWGTYRVSVDAIETLTGYNFFSNVDPSIQAVIESVVDSGSTN